jgi:hypothetical protein
LEKLKDQNFQRLVIRDECQWNLFLRLYKMMTQTFSSHKNVLNFVFQVKSALPGLVPGKCTSFEQASKRKLLTHPFFLSDIINYRNTSNLYEAKFGDDF